MNGNLLADRAVGCLAAAAVGDALGGPTEGWESHEIHDHFGTVMHFARQQGYRTDELIEIIEQVS